MFGGKNKINKQIDNINKKTEIINIDTTQEKKEEHMEEEKENDIKNTINLNEDDKKEIYNLKNENEKELIKIELSKNIVARVLLIDDEKYMDFCKFYKGYPTKKNIRIKYNTYLKLNELLLNK